MRKTFQLSIVSISSVLLMACVPLPGSSQPESTSTPESSPAAGAMNTQMAEIAQNIMAGQGYTCTFTAKDDGQEMKTRMKGQKVSMSFVDPTDTTKAMNMITDGEVSYVWDPATKQGMKMVVPKDTAVSDATVGPQVPSVSDTQDWEEAQAKYDVVCLPAVLSDSEFVPPTDVTFQDLSELTKQLPAGMMQQGGGSAGYVPGQYPSMPAAQ